MLGAGFGTCGLAGGLVADRVLTADLGRGVERGVDLFEEDLYL